VREKEEKIITGYISKTRKYPESMGFFSFLVNDYFFSENHALWHISKNSVVRDALKLDILLLHLLMMIILL